MGIEPSTILLQILSASSLSSAALSPRLDPRTRRCRSPTSYAPSLPSSLMTSQSCALKCKQPPLVTHSINWAICFLDARFPYKLHCCFKCIHAVCLACTIFSRAPTARHLFTKRLSSLPLPGRLPSASSRHSRTLTALSVSGELEIWSRGSCTRPSPGSSKTTRGETCVMLTTYHQVPFSLLSVTILHW